MKNIYLDYAASTPVDSRVLRAMEPYWSTHFGNPGSLHSFGREALSAVDHAREVIARALGGEFRDIIFTGSASEANNTILWSTLRYFLHNPHFNFIPRILISAIEHDSVLMPARLLEREGAELVLIPVLPSGIIDIEKLKTLVNERTVLVSIMHANNEMGAVQPLRAVSEIIMEHRKAYPTAPRIIFHTDAAQTFHLLDCNATRLGVDAITLSAQKLYGPKGMGALYLKESLRSMMMPLIAGGDHEFGFRAGTQNVPAVVGFGKATALAIPEKEKELKRLWQLKHYFVEGVKEIFPESEVNGTIDEDSSLPGVVSIYFPNHLSEDLLIKLDMAGVAVSSGSACVARSSKTSYVLLAMGYSKERARSSLRFSFGRFTKKADLAEAIKRLRNILK